MEGNVAVNFCGKRKVIHYSFLLWLLSQQHKFFLDQCLKIIFLHVEIAIAQKLQNKKLYFIFPFFLRNFIEIFVQFLILNPAKFFGETLRIRFVNAVGTKAVSWIYKETVKLTCRQSTLSHWLLSPFFFVCLYFAPRSDWNRNLKLRKGHQEICDTFFYFFFPFFSRETYEFSCKLLTECNKEETSS